MGSCSFPSLSLVGKHCSLVGKHCSLPPAPNTAGGTWWHIAAPTVAPTSGETQHPSFPNKPYIKLNKCAGCTLNKRSREHWAGEEFSSVFSQTLVSPHLIERCPGRAWWGSTGSSPAAPPRPPKEVVVGGVKKGQAQLVLGSLQGTTHQLWGRSGTGQPSVPKAQNTLW